MIDISWKLAILVAFVASLATSCFHAWINKHRPEPRYCSKCRAELELQRRRDEGWPEPDE